MHDIKINLIFKVIQYLVTSNYFYKLLNFDEIR
jgi:hypothetical protein